MPSLEATGSLAARKASSRKWRKIKDFSVAYSFIIPYMVLITTFSFIPIVFVFYYSVQSGSLMGNMEFVGLDNFIRVLTTQRYLNYFVTSFVYVVFTIPIGQTIAFTLACLLKKNIRGGISAFLETTIFLPLLVSMVGAGIIISFLFTPQGPINYLIMLMGFEPVRWLGTTVGARTMIIVLELWKGLGLFVFVYLTALRGVPTDYYEVAQIEGAKAYQTLYYITLPMVRRTIFFCVTMTFIWQVQIFDSVFVTTQGRPFEYTKTVVYAIYENTFLRNNPGFGSAMSVLFLSIILFVTALQNFLSKKFETLEY